MISSRITTSNNILKRQRPISFSDDELPLAQEVRGMRTQQQSQSVTKRQKVNDMDKMTGNGTGSKVSLILLDISIPPQLTMLPQEDEKVAPAIAQPTKRIPFKLIVKKKPESNQVSLDMKSVDFY